MSDSTNQVFPKLCWRVQNLENILVSRRQFLALAGTGAASSILAAPLKQLFAREVRGQSVWSKGYGPLKKDPQGLLDLPAGFQYRVFSRTGEKMSDGHPVPAAHDGMAAFAGPRGTTILIRNHELSPNETPGVIATTAQQYDPTCRGGTTTLMVGPDRQLIKHYASLAGTYRNCSGGSTPWQSWISCEENTSTPETNKPGSPTNVSKRHGYNFEVPIQASGPVPPEPLVAMGRFNHEAIAVDPRTGIVYQTEDRGDSLFYRFIPSQPGNLKAGGVLEALKIKGRPQANTQSFSSGRPMAVEWVRIEDVDPAQDTVRVEGFAKGAAQFSRGEGIAYGRGELYFTCTNGGSAGLGQVWRYIPGETAAGGTIELFVESNEESAIDGPDNLVFAPKGDLMICEDGFGGQFLIGVTPKGELYQFARNAINNQEFCGVCFSPDGKTMFVNIQDPGITFAVWGPWV